MFRRKNSVRFGVVAPGGRRRKRLRDPILLVDPAPEVYRAAAVRAEREGRPFVARTLEIDEERPPARGAADLFPSTPLAQTAFPSELGAAGFGFGSAAGFAAAPASFAPPDDPVLSAGFDSDFDSDFDFSR